MRIGHGYDVHKLIKGRPFFLGGVKIEYEWGLEGHSDADVLTHAIMDALLGAAALNDIGHVFPDSDPAYEGISSLVLLSTVMEMIQQAGYQVGNVDTTIVAQKPKLSPYIPLMKGILADTMKIPESCLNIKATTEEGLGFTGREEGIAAHAVVLLLENPVLENR